jgi:DNA-binding transcriptional MerR regulator
MAGNEVTSGERRMERNRSDNTDQRQEALFTRTIAAQLARISLDFLLRLEEEQLIQPRDIRQGEAFYSADDISQIARIRRLHEELGLDLGAVEIVLHMRRQIMDLLQRMEAMERRLARREKELLEEVQDLRRRLGVGAGWKR